MVDYKVPKPFIIKVTKIDGGENNKEDPLKIGNNQFRRIINWLMDQVGNLVMRGGCTAVTNALGSSSAKSLALWITNTAETIPIVATGDSIKYKSGIDLIDLITGLTPGSQVSMKSIYDKLYVASDGDTVKVVDNITTIREAGCVAPTVAPTVALNGAGTLTGNYYWAYTYLYPWGESSKSPTSVMLSPATQKVLITVPGTYPTGCVGIRLYRTAVGSTILKILYNLTSPTMTYDDTLTDGILGANIPTDNAYPPPSKFIFQYKNYTYYIDNSDKIWFSILNYPEIVRLTSYFNPIQNYKNRPVALANTLNPSLLIVFYETSIIAYSGTSPFVADADPLIKKEINNDIGTRSPFSVVQCGEDVLFFGSNRRIYSIDRVSLATSETVQAISLSELVEDTLVNRLNIDMIPYAQAMYVDRKYILLVATGINTYLDTAIIIDFNFKNKPIVEATPISCMSCITYKDDSGELQPYLGAYNNPNIYKLFSGYTDSGVTISPELESKHYGIDYPFNMKDWVELKIFGEATPDYQFTVRINIEKDGEEKFADFAINGLAYSTPSISPEAQYLFGEGVFNETGLFCYNVAYSTSVGNFVKNVYIPSGEQGGTRIGSDGQFMWFEILDVISTSQMKIKGYEIRGIMYGAK